MDNALRIYTLGGLSIEYNEQPVSGFVSRKVEALLVYLACTRRPQAREVLAELLWPERSQSQSLASLRGGLSNLRQVLPSNVNVTRRTVALASDPAYWIDVAEVEQLLTRAGIRDQRASILSENEAKALVKALDLYQGDFLQGFYVADSRAFEEWAEMERDRLRRIVIEALHHLVLYDLQHGVYADGIAQATRLLGLDPLHEEINRHLILLLAQAGQRTQALAQYETYCRLLDEELGVKPSSDLIALYRQIQSGAPTRSAAPQIQPRAVVLANPYKGLHPFQERDAPDFFGREASAQRLLSRLKEDGLLARFLAVVGPSGSGKSSLVRAGLIPALRKGAIPGSDFWLMVTIMPGTHPLEELATALRRLAGPLDPALWRDLESDTRGLLRIIKHILPDDAHVELFLLIDQFEEVFSLVGDENARRHFLESLLTALAEPHSRLRVVITLRADFYDRPLLYADLGELVRQGTEVVLPLSPEELQRAVIGPAERLGVQVEPAVVAQIVTDVNEQPGALPLLQYALTELFEHREDNRLTLAAYRASGGVRGTLAARAENLYAALDGDAQQMARQLFLRFVQLGEGTEDARRRVPWAEMVSVAGSEVDAHTLVDHFVRRRLLTLDHDPVTDSSTVELAHEALIREWQRFRTWIDEGRADLRQQRILAASKAEWEQAGQDRSYLLTGSRLAQFEDWAEATNAALTPEERRYLDASIAEHQRQRARRRRVRNTILAIAGAVSVAMSVLALVALSARSTAQKQRDQAEREAAVNRSLVLANAAAEMADTEGPGYALPLALEAVNMDRPPNEAMSIFRNIALSTGTRAILRDQGNAIKAVAFSPDSRYGLSGSCAMLEAEVCSQGELILWDLETRQEIRRFEGHTGWVNGVAFSPDGKAILSGSDDQTLILWDVSTGEIVRRFEGHTGGVKSIALSPDGRTAISGAADGILRIWDVTSGQTLYQLEGDAETVSHVVVSPDGKIAASDADNAVIILWDMATGQEIRRLADHTGKITALAFKPTDSGTHTLVSCATDNRLLEWDVETGQIKSQTPFGNYWYQLVISSDGRINLGFIGLGAYLWDTDGKWTYGLQERFGIGEAGAISPDGHSVLLGHSSGLLRLCGVPVNAEVRRFEADVPLSTIDISPDGHYLLTGSTTGGVVILWDPVTGQEVRRFTGMEDVTGGIFSPDGHLIALWSSDSWGTSGRHSLALVDVETGQEVHRLEGNEYLLRSVAFSPDGRYLLTGSFQWGAAWKEVGRGDLILWDVETGAMIRRFDETRVVMDIAFSPDGRWAVTTTGEYGSPVPAESGYLSLWDVSTGQLVRRVNDWADIQFPWATLWEPDGTNLFVGGQGGVAELNVETGEITRVFRIEGACGVLSMDHSADWRLLAAVDLCTPGNLWLWDLATGEQIRHFTTYKSPNWNVVFSPNGETVFTAPFGDKPVIEWQITDLPLNQLLAWVHENRYLREFTCTERAQYRIEPLCK